MTQDHVPRRFGGWMPPPRPSWLAQVIEEGRCMDLAGVVPLDEASLLATARRNTGLDDFGVDDWVEPFRVFLKALNAESDLHLMGRLMARAEILNLLEARLQIEETFKRNPGIEDEAIVKPVMILGQGRSGTSALLNLIAEDPRFGALLHWETMYPSPPPEAATYRSDPRIAIADRFITSWNRVTPEMEGMHEVGGAVPQECVRAHAMAFRSIAWLNLAGQVPSYSMYMMGQDMTPAYRYQKRLMQLLQWRNPRRHWVLKSPVHLDHLPQLLSVFPDACLVWTHRDPVKAFASVVSLIGTAQWGRCDEPFKAGSYDFVTSLGPASRRLEQVIDWIQDGTVPQARIHNIQYRDFVRDPLASVESIYGYFDIGMPGSVRAHLAEVVAKNPRSARPSHRYHTGDDAEHAEARAAFARYQQYFGVETETAGKEMAHVA